ncbi:dihydrofolate reductase family protein [Occallatibacter riparius]|uniref:Dihydrofolate reductase family protein n=1 Tax=Occallatibacter riparius TaxID=1002689 RepID=A0A9J7BJL3_9BACT|nr:dihydrofolate reductase family protein [Occallatibacter riparius]UWZ83092.1 dihydrofolate reductase family protein [Occallatibacter riparius]
MGNLIYAINLTLDGCCDHTRFRPEEDGFEYHINLLQSVDTLVFGRKTYQLMVPYWPDVLKDPSATTADIEFARAFESTRKIVFSRTLESTEDQNTHIVRGDLREEMLKLKQGGARNILAGGVDLPSQLIELGLVDEFRFLIAPTLAGAGRRLLNSASLPANLHLKLVESTPFKSGWIALRYLKQ